ncbi:MAG: protein translocase subunit SecF [Caulobacterales bacterium 32-69-10]|nr:MAG: protein translocase subunit SecF [Caulobacterales bacterium 32-69-10]
MWPLIRLLPAKTNFRYVRYAKVLNPISILLVIGSLYAAIFNPGLNFGIDFKGGTILELTTPGRLVDLGAARESMGSLGLGDVQVQAFGDGRSAQVRFQTPDNANPAQLVDRVRGVLRTALGQDVRFTRTDVVGPKVSGELFRSGLMALGFAIVLMMAYIWFRFEFRFGLGAVAGLFHDVILTFGVLAISQLEFSLTTIAAILTIIGYSMNDTVVVFDRIRENLVKYKRMPMADLIDLSVNETFSRTMITGPTAIMALVGLAVFGGETLYGFSIIIIFGLVCGTYSSIYVGAPLLLLFNKRPDKVEISPNPVIPKP